MENNPAWHSRIPTWDELSQALDELGDDGRATGSGW